MKKKKSVAIDTPFFIRWIDFVLVEQAERIRILSPVLKINLLTGRCRCAACAQGQHGLSVWTRPHRTHPPMGLRARADEDEPTWSFLPLCSRTAPHSRVTPPLAFPSTPKFQPPLSFRPTRGGERGEQVKQKSKLQKWTQAGPAVVAAPPGGHDPPLRRRIPGARLRRGRRCCAWRRSCWPTRARRASSA